MPPSVLDIGIPKKQGVLDALDVLLKITIYQMAP